MFQSQGEKFSSVFGTSKDKKIKKLPCIQGTQLQESFQDNI